MDRKNTIIRSPLPILFILLDSMSFVGLDRAGSEQRRKDLGVQHESARSRHRPEDAREETRV